MRLAEFEINQRQLYNIASYIWLPMASDDASRRGMLLEVKCTICTDFVASVASSSDLSFPDSNAGGKLLSKKDKAVPALKLKKSMTKKAKITETTGENCDP